MSEEDVVVIYVLWELVEEIESILIVRIPT